ncbi:hypothetical protein [Butyrivibrio sp. INlla21]|uniref:hypothetical protein n=1 Tax=Butyrivibrio sp. INlla21 TaxID=1520811 RepID=UPI0008EA5932|nr:hypothetical protein [Butyrivibrio sp. INlla21]SFU87514.1 hypothetical protein SAMN02910342_02156 [Butyrivibrio sp. INlla21]
MDKRVFTMAILTIISAFILVLVIVYATNADKINKLTGKGSNDDADSAASFVSGNGMLEGDQIGDNLDAFIYDDEFFDENDQVPAIVVIKENESDAANSVSSGASSEDDGSDKKRVGMGKVKGGELENPNPIDEDELPLTGSTLPPVEGTPVGSAAGN